jgi:hypothetical protein
MRANGHINKGGAEVWVGRAHARMHVEIVMTRLIITVQWMSIVDVFVNKDMGMGRKTSSSSFYIFWFDGLQTRFGASPGYIPWTWWQCENDNSEDNLAISWKWKRSKWEEKEQVVPGLQIVSSHMLVATQPIARPSSGFGGVSEMVHYLLGVVRNYVGTH